MPRTKMDELVKRLNEEEGFIPEETEEKAKAAPKKKKTFAQTDTIMCRSVVIGGLFLEGSKTKMLYEWRAYGDEVAVEYRDLVSEVRARSSFVFTPWAIIEDEDFLEEFPQVKKFYMDSYPVKDMKAILDLPVNKMVKEMKLLPPGAKDVFRNIAGEAVASGTVDSVAKIKALDEFLGTDLNLLTSLSDDE